MKHTYLDHDARQLLITQGVVKKPVLEVVKVEQGIFDLIAAGKIKNTVTHVQDGNLDYYKIDTGKTVLMCGRGGMDLIEGAIRNRFTVKIKA